MPSAGRIVQTEAVIPALPGAGSARPVAAANCRGTAQSVHSAYSSRLTASGCARSVRGLGNVHLPKGLGPISRILEPTMISLKILSTAAAMALVLPMVLPSESSAQVPGGRAVAVRGGAGGGRRGRWRAALGWRRRRSLWWRRWRRWALAPVAAAASGRRRWRRRCIRSWPRLSKAAAAIGGRPPCPRYGGGAVSGGYYGGGRYHGGGGFTVITVAAFGRCRDRRRHRLPATAITAAAPIITTTAITTRARWPWQAAPAGDDAGYCAQRYRSYDPASGTYLGYDGQRHPCP